MLRRQTWTQKEIYTLFLPPTIHSRHRTARGREAWRITRDKDKTPRTVTSDPRAWQEGNRHTGLKPPTLTGWHAAHTDESTWYLLTKDSQSSL